MVLTIYNGSPLFLGDELDSTAKKTHPRVTADQQTCMKMRNVETITRTTFALKPFLLYIITKTVRFKHIQLSPASITRNTSLDKDFLA